MELASQDSQGLWALRRPLWSQFHYPDLATIDHLSKGLDTNSAESRSFLICLRKSGQDIG